MIPVWDLIILISTSTTLLYTVSRGSQILSMADLIVLLWYGLWHIIKCQIILQIRSNNVWTVYNNTN